MKMIPIKIRYKILLLIIILIIITIVSFISILGKKGVGQVVDKLGLTKDKYEIVIDKKYSWDTYIYWHGEGTRNGCYEERLLIYHGIKQNDIPPLYGYNGFEIKFKKTIYDKIRFWKMFSYSKYNYYFNIRAFEENMIVDWHIYNWYDPDIVQGSDTFKIE